MLFFRGSTPWSKYMAPSPKARLILGLYKLIQGKCALYFYPGVKIWVVATQLFFHFQAEPRGNDPKLTSAYFSDGLVTSTTNQKSFKLILLVATAVKMRYVLQVTPTSWQPRLESHSRGADCDRCLQRWETRVRNDFLGN